MLSCYNELFYHNIWNFRLSCEYLQMKSLSGLTTITRIYIAFYAVRTHTNICNWSIFCPHTRFWIITNSRCCAPSRSYVYNICCCQLNQMKSAIYYSWKQVHIVRRTTSIPHLGTFWLRTNKFRTVCQMPEHYNPRNIEHYIVMFVYVSSFLDMYAENNIRQRKRFNLNVLNIYTLYY